MNTTENTQRIIATVIIVTAGLALASCARQSAPDERVQQHRSPNCDRDSTISPRAERGWRALAEQRAAAHAEQARGMLELAESRAELARDLAEQRASADPFG